MKRTALLIAAMLANCPTWGQSAQEIIDGLIAAGRAEEARQKAQLEAEERQRQEERDNTVIWACKCVGGVSVFYQTTIKEYEAEDKAIHARSQMLSQKNPQMSPQLVQVLSSICR